MPNGPGACLADSVLVSPAAARPVLLVPGHPLLSQTVIMTMRLRMPRIRVPHWPQAENSSHLVFLQAHGATEAAVTAGKVGIVMTAQAQANDTITAARPARRADAGTVRLSQRDIDGLLLCGEHFGTPFDLLALALRVQPERLPAIVGRWRRAGYAETGRLGPGPGWCWLTRAGMTATGLGFPATRPALGRLAHIRAVLAARLWLAGSPAWSRAAVVAFRAAAARRPPRGRAPRARARTRRSTGPRIAQAPTPGRCGRSRSS